MKRLSLIPLVICLYSGNLSAATVEYHLTLSEKDVNYTGRPETGLAVNDQIPAPTLVFHEGDMAHIHVTNRLNRDASIHWHGMLLPNRMDGVPFVTFPPIKPGATFDYEFPIRQHGTFWYHSHSRLQEQKGVYGAIVILPAGESAKQHAGRAIVLSDWTDENPHEVLRWLKRGSDWPAVQQGNAQSMLGALRAGKLGDFWKRELLRMPPMGLSDVAYDRFLANGQPDYQVAAKPGEMVRLRLINGSAGTFFHVQFAGGPLTIVAADGKEVRPIQKDKLLMAVAETYDVLVTTPGPGSYELRATAQDGSAHASVWIGSGSTHPAPSIPRANLYHAMGQLKPATIFALTPAGTMGMSDAKVKAGKFDQPGPMGGTMSMPEMMGMNSGMAMKDQKQMKPGTNMPPEKMADGSELGDGHDGKRHTADFVPLGPDIASRQPLAMDGGQERPGAPYKDLRSVKRTSLDPDRPVRDVRLTLDGDMERFVWSLNNKPLFASDSIKIRKGERVRFIMINRTMMHHPMHLHGHFFRVLNGQGDFAPLKHTVDVPPMETTVIEFAADELGDWFFHCHFLYHLESGMARVVHHEEFTPPEDTLAVREKLYRDPFYAWGTADLLSNMTQGMLELSNTQNIFTAEWEMGWEQVPKTEWETTLLYELYFNRFFRIVAGLDTEGTAETGPLDFDVETNRGVFGFMYQLPLNINARAWVDTDGGARVRLMKEVPLTPRLRLGTDLEYDSHDRWEGAVHLDYLVHRNVSLLTQWHSDYGWGVGMRVRF